MTALLDAAPVGVLTKTVLVCDHHPVVRRSLSEQFAGNHSHLRVTGTAPDGRSAVEVFATSPTDIVLVGLHRGTTSGIAAVDMLSRAFPTAPIVVFGSTHDAELLITAISHGARGLMLWDIAHPSLRPVVITPPGMTPPGMTPPGMTPPVGTPPRVATQHDPPRPEALTDFERILLRRISQGQTNLEIAHKMYLSVDAIKTRCRILFRKLGARDRAHAVALGLRDGLLH